MLTKELQNKLMPVKQPHYRDVFHMPKSMKQFLMLNQCGNVFNAQWRKAMITLKPLHRVGTLARDTQGALSQ